MARYREALALGAVRGLPEIYRAAGAGLTFDAGKIGELVQLVEAEIERVRAEVPAVEAAVAHGSSGTLRLLPGAWPGKIPRRPARAPAP